MASDQPLASGPEQEKFRTCPNCYHPMPRFGRYCANCGQKYTDGRITVMELVRQFFSDTLNLDAKIWRTLAALLVPGKLTVSFFQGRQQSYVKPLRLFFVFALFTIAAISWLEKEFSEGFFLNFEDEFSTELHYREFLQELDSTAIKLKQELPDTTLHAPIDSVYLRMSEEVSDSSEVGVRLNWGEEGDFIESFSVAKLDLVHLQIDSLLAYYEVKTFGEKLLFRQNIRLRQQEQNIGGYILNQTVWMMLLLMPVLALFLKLLYVRRSFYYVEHLIFSFHVHAFAFLMFLVVFLLDDLIFSDDASIKAYLTGFALVELYFYLALRRFYRQSYVKTFLKFLLLNLFYVFTFTIALLLTILVSALIF